ARDVVVHDDAVALPKRARHAWGDSKHGPGDLVAEDARAGHEPFLDLLDVGAADAANVDPDKHLAGSNLRDGNLFDRQLVGPSVDRGLHGQGMILPRLSMGPPPGPSANQ